MIKKNPLVMVPGPTPVAGRVLNQLARETVSFNDPTFVAEFGDTLADLGRLWHNDGIVFVVAGSGTMAMEMAVANTMAKGDRVLICSNGFFGDRYIDICQRKAYEQDVLQAEWGKSVTVQEIDRALAAKKYDSLIVTHVETSTGVELPLRELTKLLRERYPDLLLIVDGVASVGGAEVYMDWGIDVLLTCTQKALGAPPGLGVVFASDRAIKKRQSMPPIAESYVDFERWIPVMKDTMRYWGTPAVNMIWSLAEAVKIISEEGLAERIVRHRKDSDAVRNAMAALGFTCGAQEGVASPTVSVFLYPESAAIDDALFRAAVREEGVFVSACLGNFAGRGFRIGHMGNIDAHTLVSLIAAVERACFKVGYDVTLGSGLAELQRALLS